MMKRRFEFQEGSSNKFWEIAVSGASHTVTFGRLGTDGQSKTKSFANPAAAQADADKLIAEKTKKGYAEVGANPKASGAKETPKGRSEFERIAADEAKKRFSIDSSELADFSEWVRVYPSGTRLPELSLDDPDGDDVIVDGALTVDGDVLNLDDEQGRNLIVRGDLVARNIIAGGACIVVSGDARIERGVYAHYNHGWLEIAGKVRAPVVLSVDHDVHLGSVEGVTISYNGRFLADFDESSIGEILVPEVLSAEDEDEDEGPDHDAIVKRLRAGKPIIKPGVTPPAKREEAALNAQVTEGLRTLDLAGTKHRGFPKDAQLPVTVEVLDLSNTPVRALPASIGRLTALRELYLASTELEKIDAAIGQLARLEVLDLRYDEAPLPAAMAGLTELRKLRLRSLHPLKIAAGALRLPRLEVLQLGCTLAALPPDVGSISSLVELDLQDNELRELPDLALPRLERLTINNLGYLERAPSFAGLPALRALAWKGRTERTSIPRPHLKLLAPVWGLSSLVELNLDGWEALTKLPDALAGFKQLTHLDLSSTEIKVSPPLLALRQLRYLDLQFTPLKRKGIDALLEAMPEVSLKVDWEAWDQEPNPPPKIAKLLEATDVYHEVGYAKGNKRLTLLTTAVQAGLEAAEQLEGHKDELARVQAQRAAFRYGWQLLNEPGLKAKDRAAVGERLTRLAAVAVDAIPQPLAIRSGADEYREQILWMAPACLAARALREGADRPALEAALVHAEAVWTRGGYDIGARLLRVEILVALGRTDEAARWLRPLIALEPKMETLRGMQEAAWYRQASTVGATGKGRD